MRFCKITVGDYEIPVYSCNTVIAGSGAAGLSAAVRLYDFGQKDIAIVTEDISAGTSRNTGSDKQTYYKLSLEGSEPDSVREMAETLFEGQCVDGDIALVEAALSVQCFMKLVDMGVPFPVNRYGEFIGYKTDHDPRKRATSAGPLTSRLMTEALEREVREKNIPVFEHLLIVKILKENDKVAGLLCLNLTPGCDREKMFTAFCCKNIVYATGGPAGMYAHSVYPESQHGATGVAFLAGVRGKNLTEWQYGLSSVKPRWNVSGTYMQCLPCFFSTRQDGSDRKEFLREYFKNDGELLSKTFLKGYQWPFDVRKARKGSSVIDILVYIELFLKNRRVFLDFTKNPIQNIDFSVLNDEAYNYLKKAGALFGTPVERLLHMNAPAVEFYKNHGIDLSKEPLEIALCAQHNNGGLDVDIWWRTNIEGLFAVGEVAATHGVYRPGGSALNAGQVGAFRAARFIASKRTGDPADIASFEEISRPQIEEITGLAAKVFKNRSNVNELLDYTRRRMSEVAAAVRDIHRIEEYIRYVAGLIENFAEKVCISDRRELKDVFILYDTLISQYVYLNAMKDYIERGGKSRGSALYYDPDGELIGNLPEMFRFKPDDQGMSNMVQEVTLTRTGVKFNWRPVRPIPAEDGFFENIWRLFRENGSVY
ncbi:oxidoreductase [Thermoclostridium stercorarium subsp. thermolacticum DSM 2910]|uniref:Oxidoreductase n=1 Tax=Thermoclostridium stercorarium subsp. thermolacticum DSM 2910 TaxID=1121336 RepID=A0A1B1Y9X7_THEST|nr:FAD-binding protein [Thermoclostridium stercorarium]ANW97566.1 oxidoreductase [Thermoclostridium stercorarium subsp. thermolacticum DSM 2910]